MINMFKYLTDLEVQQMTFDWRYRGFTVLELLSEKECDEINAELEKLRQEMGNEKVKTGIFRAMMEIQLVNDGPVTLMVESKS